MKLSGWGRYPSVECRVVPARSTEQAKAAACSERSLIARGNGRAYGDAALNCEATLSILKCDRLIAFDAETGLLRCEAGVILADIIETFLPRGWFPPVTPGTKYVSVGGMIAADVHGKNHHRDGSFCRHVESLKLALADGTMLTCSHAENADIFAATCGGMGLTGVILEASFRLRPIESALMRGETVQAPSLDEAMAALEDSDSWTYSVAWIDCLMRGAQMGRSVIFRGEHAKRDDLPAGTIHPFQPAPRKSRPVPFDFPPHMINAWSVRAFNALYYSRNGNGNALIDYDRFFYPLDALLHWNRIYGRKGFSQYQCVLPKENARDGLRKLLEAIIAADKGSFLAVLKLLGPSSFGLLSFPMAGYTLALDFPADRGSFALMDRLDAIVRDHGGRLYLAKDARMNAAMLHAGYPDLEKFRTIRAGLDPSGKFSSLLSQRLGL